MWSGIADGRTGIPTVLHAPPFPLAGAPVIRLRRTVAGDLDCLFQFQLDLASNELAGTKPRDLATFNARWEEILRDPVAAGVTPRVIIADEVLVGSINVFPQEGTDSIGYWIGREHWGRGIATRATALMLEEVATRPLYARVATQNIASLRALERNGFVISSRQHCPATDRNVAREMITLMLA